MTAFSLAGQRILVSGASSGIGAEIARTVAEAGAAVVALGRNWERLEQVVANLPGKDHVAIACDLTAMETARPLLLERLGQTGGLTGFVHSAGVCHVEPSRFFRPQTIAQSFAINVEAAFHLVALCRSPKIRGAGQPMAGVLVSSVVSLKGHAGLSVYSASKGAVNAAVRSWAVELARENFRINAVCPGHVDGEMLASTLKNAPASAKDDLAREYPLGLGTPQDVAYAVQYLLSPASRWVTGSLLVVDGGYTAG